MLVKRHRGATAQSATPRTILDSARAFETRPMPRSPSMSPAFKSSADSSREQRLQSLIEKLKTQRTGASSSSEDEPRANPRAASKTRGRNRRLVAARGDRKTQLNTLVDLVKDAQAIYDHSKSTRAKKQLDAAKAKLKEFEADLRADQKSIDQMEKMLKDVSMRANPRRRKSSAAKSSARKTSARKSSARKTSARKTSARKSAAKTSARKPAARKPAARKSAARKPAARKPAARKSTARKSTARRVHSLGRRRSLGELDLVSGLGMLPHIAAMGMLPMVEDESRANPRRRKSRKASSATAARRKSARPAAAKKTTRRKARRNAAPAISAIGKVSALGRVSSSKRKSRKTGLPREVLRAIRSYSPHDLYVVRGGKTHHIEAKKSSSEYRDGKAHGLSGRFKSLYSKKNDHRVLHVNSVRLAFNTNRPATIDEIQKALNAWAGAFDGHHLTKHAAKTSRRANPSIRAVGTLPAVRAIGTSHRHNPASFGMFMGAMSAAPQVSMGQKVALGSASFVASLAVTNALSGLGRKMFEVGDSASTGKKVGVDVGAHVVSAALPALYLYKSSNTLKDANGERHTAMAYGWLAGVAGTAVARLAAPETFAKIPLIGGLLRVTNVNEDADHLFKTTDGWRGVGAAALQKRLPDGRKITFLQQSIGGVGGRRPVRRRGKGMSTGSYFKTGVGRYVPDTYDVVDYDDYVAPKAPLSEFILDRSLDGFGATRRKKVSARKATGMYVPTSREEGVIPGAGQPFSAGTANPLLRQPELVTGGGFGYDPNRGGDLIDEIKGIDTLDENELRQEGFDNVPPEATSYIRALPDYARQIAQQNLGLIVGPSNVIEGATIVQLFTDVVQTVNRTQIGGQADMPKGASFPRRAGVFSNSIFSSVLPSVDNGYAFMDGNIKL